LRALLNSLVHNQKRAFRLGIVAIALIAMLTRFWQLEGVDEIVFDEVYYPKYAQAYLHGTTYFDAHPPLGKYLIGLGIQFLGYNPIGYRLITALVGSSVPVLTCLLVYIISDRRSWALLAGLFTACDGLLLVESRYGLINMYMVAFGILSQICIFKALQAWRKHNRDLIDQHDRQNQPNQADRASDRKLPISSWWLWAIATGIFFGAAVAVKWNGMAYGVGIIIALVMFWTQQHQRMVSYRSQHRRYRGKQIESELAELAESGDRRNLDQVSAQISAPTEDKITGSEKLTIARQIQPWRSLLAIAIASLVIMPIVIYVLAWLPHLQLTADTSLINEHEKIWAFHQNLGKDAEKPIHPYCSPWWSWVLTIRSIAYFYQELPGEMVRDVTALGNPFLYWLGAIAILILTMLLLHRAWTYLECRFVYNVAVPKPWRQVPWLSVYMVIVAHGLLNDHYGDHSGIYLLAADLSGLADF
jgi:dolichyl-phosphate-mannose-protein mannosyltransferase